MNRYVSYLYIIIFGISYCTNIKGKVTDFETNEAEGESETKVTNQIFGHLQHPK